MPKINEKTISALIWGIILSLLVFFFLNYRSVAGVLSQYSLLPDSQPLTELYFENPQNLPRGWFRDKPVPFAFTIRNLEYRHMKYPYQILVETASGSAVLSQAVVSVESGSKLTIPAEPVLPASYSGRIRLGVKLADQNQEINFWLNELK